MAKLQVKIADVGEGKIVLVDGEPLDGVVSVDISISVQDATTVTVEFLASDVDIEQSNDV